MQPSVLLPSKLEYFHVVKYSQPHEQVRMEVSGESSQSYQKSQPLQPQYPWVLTCTCWEAATAPTGLTLSSGQLARLLLCRLPSQFRVCCSVYSELALCPARQVVYAATNASSNGIMRSSPHERALQVQSVCMALLCKACSLGHTSAVVDRYSSMTARTRSEALHRACKTHLHSLYSEM